MSDFDHHPPTQYLALEVLAARHRLGEQMWTFPATIRRTLKMLEDEGLVSTRSGPAPGSIQAALTDKGREQVLMPGYVPPILREAVEVGHLIVAEAGATTCCGRQPLELPDGHWLTEDRDDATCPALAPREYA